MIRQRGLRLLAALCCAGACTERSSTPAAESSSDEGEGNDATATSPDPLTFEFGGAWDLAVGRTAIYWVAGSSAPTCPAGAPCGAPRLEALDDGALDASIVAELESTPAFVELVGPQESIVVGTASGLVHVERNGTTQTIAAGSIGGLAAVGDDLYWVDVDASSIRHSRWLEGPDGPGTEVVALDDRNLLAFAAGDTAIAWVDYPPMSTADGQIRTYDPSDGSTLTVASDPGLVSTLAVLHDAVVWVDATGSVSTSPLDGSGEPTALDLGGATSFVGVEGRVFFGWLDPAAGQTGVSVLDEGSGSVSELLVSDYVIGDRAATVWQVRDGLLVWSGDALHATPI